MPKGGQKQEKKIKRKNKKTAVELNKELKAKQEKLKFRNSLRDKYGAKLDDPTFTLVTPNKQDTIGLNSGGKIRGVGIATQGVRAAKLR